MSQKGPPFNFFDTLQQSYLGFVVRLFFANFLYISKGSPLQFFSILQENGCSKTLKGPPFTFFGTVRLTGDQKKSKKTF